MPETFANNAAGTLSAGITNSATSLILGAGEGAKFPATGDFRIIIGSEIIRVGARTTDTLSSLTRGIENTTATAHSASAAVTHAATAGSMNDVQEALTGAMFKSGIVTASVATLQTTTSATYTDLATAGPSVTVTTGTRALVIVSCDSWQDNANQRTHMSYAVSGATTAAADDSRALIAYFPATTGAESQASRMELHTGLTAGSNTFTAKYRVSTGTGTFRYRSITVIPL